jgi:hypothetical protein
MATTRFGQYLRIRGRPSSSEQATPDSSMPEPSAASRTVAKDGVTLMSIVNAGSFGHSPCAKLRLA